MYKVLVIVGPTGVGKTELSLRAAERYHCPIINADSRQIYREIPIGTAAPTLDEQRRVKHYLIGTHDLNEDYNAGQFARDCQEILHQAQLIKPKAHQAEGSSSAAQQQSDAPIAIISGGSMLYIDAVCKGLDDIPDVPTAIRQEVRKEYETQGLEWLQTQVQVLDPVYWQQVDQHNPQRLMHCIEVTRAAGRPYSTYRQQTNAKLSTAPYAFIKVGLNCPRAELYDRINRRTLQMMEQGFEEEAHRVWLQYRQDKPNSLNTVGYKELFAYFEGQCTREEAIEKIQQHTRNYAKRQLTWLLRDKTIHWLDRNTDYETQLHTIHTWLDAADRL